MCLLGSLPLLDEDQVTLTLPQPQVTVITEAELFSVVRL